MQQKVDINSVGVFVDLELSEMRGCGVRGGESEVGRMTKSLGYAGAWWWWRLNV